MAQENDPTKQTPDYASRLQALLDRTVYDFATMAGGVSRTSAGEGAIQPLPFAVSVDGQPRDVLFTVSVGNKRDERGGYRPIGYPHQNGGANAVNMAAKTYAVVREPYSNNPAVLLELTPAELAEGHCDYSSRPQDGQPPRILARIPGPQEQGLRLEVPISQNQNQGPADMLIHMAGNDMQNYPRRQPPSLHFYRSSNIKTRGRHMSGEVVNIPGDQIAELRQQAAQTPRSRRKPSLQRPLAPPDKDSRGQLIAADEATAAMLHERYPDIPVTVGDTRTGSSESEQRVGGTRLPYWASQPCCARFFEPSPLEKPGAWRQANTNARRFNFVFIAMPATMGT